jgi:hypothetical protein
MAGLLDLYSSPIGLLAPSQIGNPFDAADNITPEMYQAAFGIYPRAFPRRAPTPDPFASATPAFMPDISGPTNLPQSFIPPVAPEQAAAVASPEASTDLSSRRAMPPFMAALGLPGPLSVPQTTPRVPPTTAAAAPVAATPAAPPTTRPGFFERLGTGINAHPYLLMAAGAGLASGKGIGGALTGALQGAQLDTAQAQQQQTQQAIAQSVLARGGTQAEAIAAATNPEFLKAFLGREYAPRKIELQGGNIISTDASKNTAQTLGTYPTFQKMQPGESGQYVTPGVPGGVGSPTAAPSAQTVVPGMSLEEKSAAQKRGELVGENEVKLPATIDQAQTALRMVDELQRHPQLNNVIGPVTGNLSSNQAALLGAVGLGPEAADAINRIDQLKGQAFLSAFSSLRGGGQISNIEGEKATQAVTRLNRATTPEAFNLALNDLRDVLQLGLKNAYLQAAKQPMPAQGQWQTIAPNVRIRQVP